MIKTILDNIFKYSDKKTLEDSLTLGIYNKPYKKNRNIFY